MFAARELTIVHGVELIVRGSEKRVAELAEGVARPAGESCLVLVEAAADTPRKTLAPLRAAAAALVDLGFADTRGLLAWGRRRLAAECLAAARGTLEALLRSCENESVSFLSELGKLVSCCAGRGRVTVADVASLERPVVGAGLADYLLAVAAGDAGARRAAARPAAGGRRERGLAAVVAREHGGRRLRRLVVSPGVLAARSAAAAARRAWRAPSTPSTERKPPGRADGWTRSSRSTYWKRHFQESLPIWKLQMQKKRTSSPMYPLHL